MGALMGAMLHRSSGALLGNRSPRCLFIPWTATTRRLVCLDQRTRDGPGLSSGPLVTHHPAMKFRSVLAILLAAVAVLLVACGSSDAGPATTADTGVTPGNEAGPDGDVVDANLPPIDPGTDVGSLTDAQRGELCDWTNSALGGYDLVTDCGGGNTVRNDTDQAACVAHLTYRCPVTVGQFETCVLAEAPSRGCVFPFDQCHPLVCQ
jgi:hypothetical protein